MALKNTQEFVKKLESEGELKVEKMGIWVRGEQNNFVRT